MPPVSKDGLPKDDLNGDDLKGDLKELTDIMERLRSKDGCPWDREQDFSTLIPYVIEEAYEVVSAIDSGSRPELKDELGDLLFQVVFLSQLAKEEGSFDISDVIKNCSEKMIRRHPHVFADLKADTSDDVLRNWADIKEEEKALKEAGSEGGNGASKSEGYLSDVPDHFPALMKAHKVSKRAAKVGFDWDNLTQVFDKVSEEISELKEALAKDDREAVEEEMGDIFFALVNVSRFVSVDPENALRKTIGKFINRFHHIETSLEKDGNSLTGATLDEMETLWEEAKTKKVK